MIMLDVSAAVHRRAGLGRYAESLARALVSLNPARYGLFFNQERGIEPLAGLEHVPVRTVSLGYKPWRMLVWLGQLAHLGFDRLLPGTALFHATEHLLLPLRGMPTVLTVHDLIFRHLPEHHKLLNRWYLNLTLPLFCRRATHVIAISECTRRDLLATYGVSANKVTVVHEAASPEFRPQPADAVARIRARHGLPERYLLFVGTIEPRKNLTRLLAAFETVHAEGLSQGLVIVGRRGWLCGDFFESLERSPVRRAVILPGYVADADLPALYAGAQALALPSLYEGFGLPVLEAMACGTPVVCSNTSALKEIAGDASVAVDPHDPDSIVAGLGRVLTDSALSNTLVAKGIERAASFSWHRVAAETQAVYNAVLSEE
jgi:glycosyltransferase involved in cell wall biosynthesis